MMDWKCRLDEMVEKIQFSHEENPNELADPSFTWFGNTMTKPATESSLMCRWLLLST